MRGSPDGDFVSSQRIRKPPKSLSAPEGARKDLAVHASLSSNQIVKEPDILSETGTPPSRSKSSLGRNRFTGQAGGPHCLSGTPNRRGEQAQALQPMERLIYSPPPTLSTMTECRDDTFFAARRNAQTNPAITGTLAPSQLRRHGFSEVGKHAIGCQGMQGAAAAVTARVPPARPPGTFDCVDSGARHCQEGHEEAKFLRPLLQ